MRPTTCAGTDAAADLDEEYRELLEAYDRAGLPYERGLTRLGYAAWLMQQGRRSEATAAQAAIAELGRKYGMQLIDATRP